MNVPKVVSVVAVLVNLALVALFVCEVWLYFYSGDLPNLVALTRFAPDSSATVSLECSDGSARAIPFTSIGANLQNATLAVEGRSIPMQIAGGLFCDPPMKHLKRHLLEYKASVQLQRRFSDDELLTIYLNRAYFGKDLIGVENASLHYYGKHAAELDLAQAALIAGLLKGPVFYSPERHPERAKQRRDTVIEAMLKNGAITAEQAKAAEQSAIPLNLLPSLDN